MIFKTQNLYNPISLKINRVIYKRNCVTISTHAPELKYSNKGWENWTFNSSGL